MTYDEAKKAIFAHATRPDGYFGETCRVGFAFDTASGKTLEVASCGYFTSVIPQALDQAEALWLLTHHPTARWVYSNLQEAI